ncbi:DNA-methyltransferase [Paenibacillus agricola]|uniref:Site-specific DNA-methyltransferase n=1 Tax=Paenibacillus agricola TaxID=2716264 RepID=A0ABX0JFU4_9BACL|nr:site-specific DNA-methyltransferase [Paenibacillus agricola]NHN35420.1 site-specific DNA-methyltransferase [Paenibacillus agricola]
MQIQPKWNFAKNALILGENDEIIKYFMKEGLKNSFHMIYFDGPFNSGLLFTANQPEHHFEYMSPWSQYHTIQNYFNPNRYMEHYRKRIELAKQLLREDGIFVLQTNMMNGHHLKVLLDEVFGRENFQSEVIWKHTDTPWKSIWGFPVGYQHETLLFYSKSARYLERIDPDANFPSVWDDISGYQYSKEEETHYPSQKPEKLIERILDITTQEGDLVGDFYCGSGSLPYVAEKKGRRWIACDNNQFSIQITHERLAKISRSFELYDTVDEFQSGCLNGKAYNKHTLTPISYKELQGLQDLHEHIEVSAYHFSPDVDLANDNQQFTFQYIFPLVTENGFSEFETIKMARPIPVVENGHIRLHVPNELEWILYHMVFVERNHLNMLNSSRYETDCNRIFQLDKAIQKAREIQNQIQGNWIQSLTEENGLLTVTDLFGYHYNAIKV